MAPPGWLFGWNWRLSMRHWTVKRRQNTGTMDNFVVLLRGEFFRFERPIVLPLGTTAFGLIYADWWAKFVALFVYMAPGPMFVRPITNSNAWLCGHLLCKKLLNFRQGSWVPFLGVAAGIVTTQLIAYNRLWDPFPEEMAVGEASFVFPEFLTGAIDTVLWTSRLSLLNAIPYVVLGREFIKKWVDIPFFGHWDRTVPDRAAYNTGLNYVVATWVVGRFFKVV